jgi:hypothetical protein
VNGLQKAAGKIGVTRWIRALMEEEHGK